MPIESEIVDASIDDEAIEAQRPNVVAVGRGRPSCTSSIMLHLDTPGIKLGVMYV